MIGSTIELRMLAWSIGLGLLQLLLAGVFTTAQRGLQWNLSARDGVAPTLRGYAARADRAWKNFMETFPFFAAAVLAVVVSGRTSAATALGVQLYFWARVAYVPLYVGGVPYARTLVWAIGFWGMLKVLIALF